MCVRKETLTKGKRTLRFISPSSFYIDQIQWLAWWDKEFKDRYEEILLYNFFLYIIYLYIDSFILQYIFYIISC